MAQLGTTLVSAVALAAALAWSPGSAAACSPGSCVPGRLVPRDGATIPENTPALAWRPPIDFMAPGDSPRPALTVSRIDGDAPVVVEHEEEDAADGWVWIRLSQWHEGARYRVEVAADCGPDAVELEVGPAAPLPDSLGQVVTPGPARQDLTVATVSGSCVTEIPAMVLPVSLEPDDSVRPWAELLLFQTMVDGEPWAPSWSLGPVEPHDELQGSDDLVFTECEPDPGQSVDDGALHDGVDPGEHAIRIDATLPGHAGTLQSGELISHLSCEARDGGGGGCSASGDPARAAARHRGARAWLLLVGSVLGLIWLFRRRDWVARVG